MYEIDITCLGCGKLIKRSCVERWPDKKPEADKTHRHGPDLTYQTSIEIFNHITRQPYVPIFKTEAFDFPVLYSLENLSNRATIKE